jgi:FkbM family methyltransferase
MIKKLSYLIYIIIILIDKLIKLFKNTSLISAVYNQIKNNSYSNIILNKKKIVFFTPTLVTKTRVETFFTKEPETLKWIDEFDRKKNIFWDIGSNMGQYAIYASTRNKNNKTFAFEPSASNLVLLSRNISINKLSKNISIIPFGISYKKNSFFYMNESKFEEGAAMHEFGSHKKSEYQYNVFGTTLENLIKNKTLSVPNYVKIDVDGTELQILQSFGNFLKNKKIKSILIELDTSNNKVFKKCLEIMKSNKLKFISKNRSDLYRYSKLTTYNYIFKR